MKTQEINLKSGEQVIINHDSKTKCKNCGKEIIWAATKNQNLIKVELVSLMEWERHSCKK